MRSSPLRSARLAQAGFSLIEILVGIVIGAVALLAIAQTVVLFDKHVQTTSSGGDAQMAGTLAMFNLERDIKQAGLGFGTADLATMGCTVQAEDTSSARVFTFPLSPVVIQSGGAAGPDTIDVLYGNSSFFVSTERFDSSSPGAKRLVRRAGFRPGDLAVVAGNAAASAASATCHLVEITTDSDPNGWVFHSTGAYATFYAAASAVARFNPAAGTGTVFSAGTLHNLGPAPQLNRWQIQGGQGGRMLVRTPSLLQTGDLEVAEGVVSLKAQYGVDNDADGRISDGEWTNAAPASWPQVLAVRIAVLVRSRQFERDSSASAPRAVTTVVPTWSAGASAPFAMTDVTGGTSDSFSGSPNTADPANWRFYRYRVYERVIPLRNTIWGQ